MEAVAVLSDPGPAGRWIGRVGAAFTFPIARELQTLAAREAVKQHPVWTQPPLDARGLPVMVVGGLASTGTQLAVLHEWLSRVNCRVRLASIGFGLDCGERTAARVTEQLAAFAEESGERCLLLGHSRGGQIARAVAVREPSLVRGLVVLGSPLNRLLGVHPLLKVEVALLGLAGTVGLPGLLRPSCLWGMCCRGLRRDLAAVFPREVPYLSVFSRRDRMVDWRSSVDPAARHREVSTTHSGLVCAPEAFGVLAEELREVSAHRLRRAGAVRETLIAAAASVTDV